MLSKNTVSFINETINKAIEENNKAIYAEINSLKKDIAKLSVNDNAPLKKTATKTASKSKKSEPKTAKQSSDTVQRCYIHATKRLEGSEFTKLYALVKEHNGRIKNSGRKDKDGKKLACWSFTIEDGKAFANAVVENKLYKSKKAIPLKSEIVTLK